MRHQNLFRLKGGGGGGEFVELGHFDEDFVKKLDTFNTFKGKI